MKTILSVRLLLFFFIPAVMHGQAAVVDEKVNEYKGTFVARKIIKDKSLNKKEAQITIRMFQYYWKPMKGGPDAPNLLTIDTSSYALNTDGFITTAVNAGNHTLGVTSFYNPPFHPFRSRILKFKKRRHYYIDMYLSAPVLILHH